MESPVGLRGPRNTTISFREEKSAMKNSRFRNGSRKGKLNRNLSFEA